MRRRLRAFVRRAGFDVVRYPPGPTWTLEALVRAVLAREDISHVIDAGGGGGWLRDLGYSGTIVSFGPSTGGEGRWDVHPVALGPAPAAGVARLDDRLDTVVPPSARLMLDVDSPLDLWRGAERSLARILAIRVRVAEPLERATWLRDRGFTLAGIFPGAGGRRSAPVACL